ncbi:MAG: hypothetical protein JWP01_1970 [Myxococcales bacterium]|nr:hypothetical protein [Myxococcales bacterium]
MVDGAGVASPLGVSADERSLLIYDGDCQFCRRSIERWQGRTGDRIDYRPLQQPGLLRALGAPLADALRSVQLVTASGRRYEGADAALRALGTAPGLRGITRLARLPLARWIAEAVYRRIARHRDLADRIDVALFGRSTLRPDAALIRSVFMRALGGVYLIAFASLRRQVLGLYGRDGIQPIHEFLAAMRDVAVARSQRGERRSRRALDHVRLVPSWFWLDASDLALVRACVAGELGAALLMLGIAPR